MHAFLHARRRVMRHHRRGSSRGFTLIELMVALTLGLLVTGATVAALIAARRGFTTVDDGSQLRENARFSVDMIERIAVQSGFEDVAAGQFSGTKEKGFVGINGYDNSVVDQSVSPPGMVTDSRNTACGGFTDTSCVNGSDVLMFRYQGTGTPTADGAMINCSGVAVGQNATLTPSISIFHVVREPSGEPSLACSSFDGTAWTTRTLVQGVEAFQVLYGVDNVSPNVAPPVCSAGLGGAVQTADSVPDRWLTARQMVAPTTVDTDANWRRVRSLRIGMIFRGAPNQAQNKSFGVSAYDVFGLGHSSAADVLSHLPIPADGRLRQPLLFDVHLRNPQTYCL